MEIVAYRIIESHNPENNYWLVKKPTNKELDFPIQSLTEPYKGLDSILCDELTSFLDKLPLPKKWKKVSVKYWAEHFDPEKPIRLYDMIYPDL